METTSLGNVHIGGSVNVELNGNTWAQPIGITIPISARYDKNAGMAMLKVDSVELGKRCELLTQWLGMMPDLA